MQVDLSVELAPPSAGLAGLRLKNPILVAPGKIAKVEEEITEVVRPFSVRLRTSPEAVGESQSGLMLRALSCCGSSYFEDQGKTLAVNLIVGRTES